MNNAQKYLASLSPDERRAILSKGGKSVKHRRGLFKDGEDRAKDAGRKGGLSTARERRTAKAVAETDADAQRDDGLLSGVSADPINPGGPS